MKNLILILFFLSCSTLDAETVDPKINLRSQLQSKMTKNHKALSYKEARRKLFGSIHLEGNNPGNYIVRDIYCTKDYTTNDFPTNKPIGPNLIPDHRVINAEHVWPQSRFSKNKKKVIQKQFKVSDLHILYPSNSRLNSARGNHKFAEIENPSRVYECSGAKLGQIKGETYFEPPNESKGNVARSSFYFSVRYNRPIDPNEEKTLRIWHRADPIDAMEKRRNNLIEKYQGNRNPFIDSPALVQRLKDF